MNLKSKLATFAGALLLSTASFANTAPFTCPGLAAIKAEGVTMAEEILSGYYATFHYSQFDDKNSQAWVFLLGPVEGNSVESALETGNKVVDGLSAEGNIEVIDDTMVCIYETNDQMLNAVAIKANDSLSMPRMKQILRKAG